MTLRPGAMTSGLVTPAAVGPRLDQSVIMSSLRLAVPRSSNAPTVTTSGSSPGLTIVPGPGPVLPAAATTTMPSCQSRSTAKSSGSTLGSWVDGTPQDRLSTRMLNWFWYAATQCIACNIVETSTDELRPATLTAMTFAAGASPV